MIIEEAMTPPSPREELPLKLPDLVISPEDPWNDDVLGRRDLGARLTRLIQNQQAPFVISIDGSWGTGKTFLLQRWQASLERQGFRAIYFNAWEDDFCDDPLLAILGQLSEYFKEGKLKEFASEFFRIAGTLLKQNALSVLHHYTGLTGELDGKEQPQRDLLQEYLDQRATKDELKQHLVKMAAAVYKDSEHPLVFIIDELDRCRPTFAIELLERVKHIFDVPNLVFVFGINRNELCSALQSVYGNIDATVYLRRFFDMEFMLSETDSADFCRNLIDRFEIAGYFAELGKSAATNLHVEEFRDLAQWIPAFWRNFGMSLRDIDYCVRMIALVCRNLQPEQFMYPWLLSVLIPLKLTNPTLYRRFIQGNCHASTIIDYVDNDITYDYNPSSVSHPMGAEHIMDLIETHLYRAESQRDSNTEPPTFLTQLRLLHRDTDLTHPMFVSEKTKRSSKERLEKLIRLSNPQAMPGYWGNMLDHIAGMIDLHQSLVRR